MNMLKKNHEPLPETAAKDNPKSNVTDSILTYEIRKQLISIANEVKREAYQLSQSSEILRTLRSEIDRLRLMVRSGGDL